MKDFTELKKNLKKHPAGANHRQIKLAILADTATQLFTQAIKGYGYEVGLDFQIFEADYNQIERQVFDASSELYQFKPEFVIVFHSTQKLLKGFYGLNNQEKTRFADLHLEKVANIYNIITSTLPCKVIYFNLSETNDNVFGNYANKVASSFIYQLRKINYELMNLSQTLKNLFINDLNSLQSQYGQSFLLDQKVYINTDIIFSIDFLPIIAKNTTDIIQTLCGRFKKCLILDLDNTLWGGIIGDDGIENIQIADLGIGKAFTELQLWLKQLKQRGIILTVCSQNDEAIAKEPFQQHPDMVLRLEDIAVFVANRNNKVDNIRYIQTILNIGFDSMVFLDDSPFERDMVRTFIPEISVPELPEDPAEYLSYLKSLNLLETASYTAEDAQRTQQYQQEAKRIVAQKSFTNADDFLASLEMASLVRPFDKFNIPRVAQLTQRSNQFNLRTIRYTEEQIQKLASSDDFLTLSFTLKDKFGDYGLISIVILKREKESLFIDTWIMSCRVLRRGIEGLILNQIINLAKEHGFKKLAGEYIPTAKNGLVKEHYPNLGFHCANGNWLLNIDNYQERPHFITVKQDGN